MMFEHSFHQRDPFAINLECQKAAVLEDQVKKMMEEAIIKEKTTTSYEDVRVMVQNGCRHFNQPNTENGGKSDETKRNAHPQ